MAGRGRPSKYETHIKPRFNDIEKWLELGATEKEIYTNLKISKDTWITSKSKYPELIELIKKSRKKPVEQIKAALLKRAIGFEYEEKKRIIQNIEFSDYVQWKLDEAGINYEKLEAPKLIKTEITTKVVLPDTAACLILLQHWAKDEGWTRDPQQLELKKQELKLKEKKIDNESW